MSNDKLREAAEKAAQMIDDLNSAYGSDEVQKVADDLRAALTATQQAAPSQRAGELAKGLRTIASAIRDGHIELLAADVRLLMQVAALLEASAQREQPAASKPEPQAQAGEPEVVAIGVKLANTGHIGPVLVVGRDDDEIGDYVPSLLVELITLQSHREAMAKTYQNTKELVDQKVVLHESIANYRAALKACVEALEYYQSKDTTLDAKLSVGNVAITQAKEAMKS